MPLPDAAAKEGAKNFVNRANHQRKQRGMPELPASSNAEVVSSLKEIFKNRIEAQLQRAKDNVGKVLPPGTIARIQALDAAGKQAVIDAITAAEGGSGS